MNSDKPNFQCGINIKFEREKLNFQPELTRACFLSRCCSKKKKSGNIKTFHLFSSQFEFIHCSGIFPHSMKKKKMTQKVSSMPFFLSCIISRFRISVSKDISMQMSRLMPSPFVWQDKQMWFWANSNWLNRPPTPPWGHFDLVVRRRQFHALYLFDKS